MSSSGLIYAVIVGAWAAYLVPMWLRRQDELNEARPTERFSTAIRLLSGRAAMERRYAKDHARATADEAEGDAGAPDAVTHAPDAVTDSVDVRSYAVSRTGTRTRARLEAAAPDAPVADGRAVDGRAARASAADVSAADGSAVAGPERGRPERGRPAESGDGRAAGEGHAAGDRHAASDRHEARDRRPEGDSRAAGGGRPVRDGAVPRRGARPAPHPHPSPGARRAKSPEAMARARRSRVLARRRRTTVVLFLAFTAGSVGAAVGGLAFLWAPGVPAVLLSTYIAHLRGQERQRFAVRMDRQQAEVAARRLKERERRRRTTATERPAERPAEREAAEPERGTDPGLSAALAAGRRALVEQTDHAEWLEEQREPQRRPGPGESWEPVPVPLPTYVTAPVAPRATSDLDLSAPDAWSSARSSTVGGEGAAAGDRRTDQAGAGDFGEPHADGDVAAEQRPATASPARRPEQDAREDVRRRAVSARRSRGRGRTPLFDQYADPDRPRAANE